MALDRTQRDILESLLKKPQTIKELMSSTGYSDTSVRQNLKMLIHDKELILDKARQPYLYSIAPNSPELYKRKKLEEVKLSLLSGQNEDDHYFIKAVKRTRKEEWVVLAQSMDIIAQAIEELDADGLLIDTLEAR